MFVPQSAHPPDVAPATSRLPTLPARPAFAGFWLRAVACLIDTLLIVGIMISVASFFPSAMEKLVPSTPVSLTEMPQPPPILVVAMAALICLYYTVFEASSWQATPGKRILRLYVTDLGGRRITFRRALVRNLARQISGFLFIGFLVAGFTEKKQALHDILAGCLVLRRP